ncbi:Uncharacterized Fe-S cluster protein YjdI [Micromonospora rhizosphaerae]|uniref:Uncharacterized Fe-S cluster protein YjdI n=1 Tax=Micromonospora rhizosphaerae TaxID=568872 RepID=A0A1C6SZZ7_9ACTN|nr:(4Fe-4S)-binding protein [Micromonospora rhizosphaerae]SCL34843.1 Uncharacterized Fe-S cluster protein YjdI [Micromonospora rhizosphaerae]
MTEPATHDPFDDGKRYSGPEIVVSYNARRCRHAGECVRGLPKVFDVGRRPWILPGAAPADEVATVIRRCPTGALQYRPTTGADTEQPDPVTTVRAVPGGPLLLRGDLRVWTDQPGVGGGMRCETRMAACACGATGLAPYCDGSCDVEL